MKRLFILLFFLASCTSLQQMNSNMKHATELMAENTQTMTSAKEIIAKNTEGVQKSTATTKEFEAFMTIIMAAFLIASIALYCLYYKLIKTIGKSDK